MKMTMLMLLVWWFFTYIYILLNVDDVGVMMSCFLIFVGFSGSATLKKITPTTNVCLNEISNGV